MVHYLLATDEQKELANLARKILDKDLKPILPELEKANDGLGEYPFDVHKKMVEAGFYAMNIPEEWGGMDMDFVTMGIIAEEIAQVDAAFCFDFIGGGLFFPKILETSMPEEEKRMWAKRHLEEGVLGGFCLTEPSAGSDAKAITTSAVKDGDEWVINGRKCFVSRGPTADFYLVFAWTDKTKKAGEGITMFFVEKEREGIQVGKHENKLGMKLAQTSDVIFEDVRVPEDHVVGEVGKGFSTGIGSISLDGRALGIAYNVGLAQAALDHAVEYAKTRRQFGKRIIDHEGLGFLIADMQTRTEASRALLYQTLEAIDAGKSIGNVPSMLKLFATDATMQTTIDAVQVLGGYGYMKDYPVEKLMRDAKIFQIFSGTNQIMRRTIARGLAGRDPLYKKA